MNEYSSVLRDLEVHERQAYLRDRARRELRGTVEDRERRWSLRKVIRHSA